MAVREMERLFLLLLLLPAGLCWAASSAGVWLLQSGAHASLAALLLTGQGMSGARLHLAVGQAWAQLSSGGVLVGNPERSVAKPRLFLLIICCCQRAGSVWVGVTERTKITLLSPWFFPVCDFPWFILVSF